MLGKPSITVCRKIGFLISITVLLAQTTGCQSEEGDSKMMNIEKVDIGNTDSAIIGVVNLSGNVMFADVPATKGANLQGTGTLKAMGESSWIDIEYLGGEKIRLKNGSVELSFGEQLTSNIGGLDLGGGVGSTGTNTRIIKLKSGKLFAHIAKFEQLRKMKYYFSTDIIDLNLMSGSFALEVNNDVTRLSVCEGSISIRPANAMESSQRANWPEVNLSGGSGVSVNLTDTPEPSALSQSEKELMAKEFSAMAVSTACSSS